MLRIWSPDEIQACWDRHQQAQVELAQLDKILHITQDIMDHDAVHLALRDIPPLLRYVVELQRRLAGLPPQTLHEELEDK